MSSFGSNDDFGPPLWLLLLIGLTFLSGFCLVFGVVCRIIFCPGKWRQQNQQGQLPTYTSPGKKHDTYVWFFVADLESCIAAISVPPPINSSAYVQHYMNDQNSGRVTLSASAIVAPLCSSETNYAHR
ncbi:hypothetical protein HDE_14103 [Halotydeus destructor]|nr:hypothetical protein HDE_14103 [Halotydeus destructor]